MGYVDLLGTTYSSPTLATGFGAHIALPLLREAYEAKAGIDGTGPLLTREEAEALVDDCMKVLFYRDARSLNKVRMRPRARCETHRMGLVAYTDKQYQIATITAEGIQISDSKSSKTEWGFAEGLRGYGGQTQ